MTMHNDFISSAEMIQNSSCYTHVGLIKRDFDARAQVLVSALLLDNCLTVEIMAEQKVWESINTDRYSAGGLASPLDFPFLFHLGQGTALKRNSSGVARNVIAFFFFKVRNLL